MHLRKLLRPLFLTAALTSAPGLAQEAAQPTSELRSHFIGRTFTVDLAPLPTRFDSKSNPITPEKVALGRMLYFDARLSKNHDVSCNSCHDLARYGVDAKPVSHGHKQQTGSRNSPTVYNAAGHVAQFWDGRAADVEEQAKGPVLNPVEMAMPSEAQVVATLESIPGYVTLFQRAFAGEAKPVTYDNMAKAIGAFERGLVTPSRFDRYLKGEEGALSEKERRGLQRFAEVGCTLCHNGPAVGGNGFHRLGLMVAYPDQRDQGLYEQTKRDDHRMIFRTPSLRNVARTGPYFHDGSVQELSQAVRLMGRHQLARELTDEDVDLIVTFLESLTGELPGGGYISRPALPPSGPNTPRPDPT